MYSVYTYIGISCLIVFVEDVDQCQLDHTDMYAALHNVMNKYWWVVSIIFLSVGGWSVDQLLPTRPHSRACQPLPTLQLVHVYVYVAVTGRKQLVHVYAYVAVNFIPLFRIYNAVTRSFKTS